MKAVLIEEGTHRLYIGEAKEPCLGDEELLVRVKATALNRADLLQRKGMYPPPPGASNILGLEMAGVVEQIGSCVSGWRVGDRVCALLPGGGYAQKVTIPAQMAIPIPGNLSFEQAASIPEAYLTAYLHLIDLGGLKAGEHVLLHAAASGVGTAAIQLVREVGGIVIATAGSRQKLEVCAALGADHVVNYKEENFAEKVMQATANQGVQLILDPVGASHWQQNLQSIAVDGRWVLIGGMGGYEVEKVNLRALMQKRVRLIGSTLRSLSAAAKMELTSRFVSFAQDKFAAGKLLTVVDQVFDWEQAMEAHAYMEQNKNIGKIVLRISCEEER